MIIQIWNLETDEVTERKLKFTRCRPELVDYFTSKLEVDFLMYDVFIQMQRNYLNQERKEGRKPSEVI